MNISGFFLPGSGTPCGNNLATILSVSWGMVSVHNFKQAFSLNPAVAAYCVPNKSASYSRPLPKAVSESAASLR